MGWQGSEEGVGPPTYCSPSISGAPVISSTSGPLNGNSCAAESERREAEIAYEKHSSPEAVKTFIIITNLQAPTEPAGAHAAKQALQLLGFHISPLCIRRLEGSFFAGHTQKKLIYWLVYCRCAFSSRRKEGMRSVCMCASLYAYRKNKNICACVLAHRTCSPSKQTEMNFYAPAHTTGAHAHVCLCCVCALLDAITLRETGRLHLLV